jgi:hypothetical protein
MFGGLYSVRYRPLAAPTSAFLTGRHAQAHSAPYAPTRDSYVGWNTALNELRTYCCQGPDLATACAYTV